MLKHFTGLACSFRFESNLRGAAKTSTDDIRAQRRMGDVMDIVFQKALVEALRYGYVTLQLSIARARHNAKENRAERS
jgi:hypothetical protein